uniref:Zinc finger protein 488 n=1 Tax=Geotrypetes seraphini TaxID=260995 RepID=A0A6P8QU33_GEOSA|nr:zinc finger protein 488 [Geotrypetes seraphini]XP_033799413.1 zinc finger protein 488 [Geotrypetes seraphini]XP_033799415.1 zinc finger protein 488 [Geotrypetes seraphini]XP_033799416.1 zinc finger protein 488 [Geotrypetes seraphini]XP_033799417.1 zinc finger protein 488 [Geotrypetes seraphini]
MMDFASYPKLLWSSDSKFFPQQFQEMFATVHTTQDIPEGTTLGPCMLQCTFLDTITSIALKCSDRRNIHYVFKVDAASANSSAGLAWARLVQAAHNSKEQNVEAYLKNSQMYFRSTRKINKNDELLVWYDEELSRLLGFADIKAKAPSHAFRCPECDQEFKWENPYLSHIRFLCVPEQSFLLWTNPQDRRIARGSLIQQSTNFHSLARDLEVKMAAVKDALDSSAEKTLKPEAGEITKSRKMVLSEKTNNLGVQQDHENKDNVAEHVLTASIWRLGSAKQVNKDSSDRTQSAFSEVWRTKEKLKNEKAKNFEQDVGGLQPGKDESIKDSAVNSTGSAFSFVWSARADREQRSAFSKPAKSPGDRPETSSSHSMTDSGKSPGDLPGLITSTNIMPYGHFLSSKCFVSDVCNSQLVQANMTRGHSFLYPVELWSNKTGIQSPSPSSLTLLPPTYRSLSVSAQNWCAKCNLSFRMTSDLVLHMRSHHKKEYTIEPQCKRRREEKLTCPICHEYFRERHHLSRHMTSHN